MRGDGRVFKRGRIWWFAYMALTRDGRATEVRESSGSDSEVVASKMLRARLREVANHRSGVRAFAGPKAERLSVADLLDSLAADYRQRRIKSLRRTLSHMKPVREYFGDSRALALNTDHVRGFIALRSQEGASNATINRELGILSAAFTLALNEERITRRPYIRHLPESRPRSGFFEADQQEIMLLHLPYPLDEMARFAYACGWRRDEVRTLRWEWVDRIAREVRLPDSKNNQGRVLPLDGELWDLFERMWDARAYVTRGSSAISEYVFHVDGRPVSDTQFSRLWDRAKKAAGPMVAGRIFHDYRRTAVRNMMRAGVQQSVVMKITGHRSDAIFRRYNITSTGDKLEALERQRRYLAGGAQTAGTVADGTERFGQNSDNSKSG